MGELSRLRGAAAMTLTSVRRAVHSPGDALLALRIANFIRHLPANLDDQDLPTFLRRVRTSPRPAARDVRAGVARIKRIRDAVLSLPRFWHWNTCYVRALTLYRFVDAGGRELRFHFGIERRERLHGHAWITLDHETIEAPEGVMLSGLREVPIDAVA